MSIKLPLLPLRDVVVFPQMVVPLFVGREKSIKALEAAMESDKQILLLSQVHPDIDQPDADNLHTIGTVSSILQILRLPDGTVKVLVEGCERAKVVNILDQYSSEEEYFMGVEIEILDENIVDEKSNSELISFLRSQFEQYVKLSKKIPNEVLSSLSGIEVVSRYIDSIASHLILDVGQKQQILSELDPVLRAELLIGFMDSELELHKVENKIRGRVKKQMEKSQREYYLNEQMKAIQKELGDMEDAPNELEELQNKINESGMPEESLKKVNSEFSKLKMMSPMSAEASVVRTFIDTLVNLPWKKKTKLRHDIKHAKKILDQDHFGLIEVKDRIIEFLAVQKRVKKIKGPVLCLVGPPGVGKTSLGESIARATNRKFIRMALGGVRDEAEIRGHRRTYIGSMPGKIIQKLSKAGVKIPYSFWMKLIKWVWIIVVILHLHYWKSWIQSKIIPLMTTI